MKTFLAVMVMAMAAWSGERPAPRAVVLPSCLVSDVAPAAGGLFVVTAAIRADEAKAAGLDVPAPPPSSILVAWRVGKEDAVAISKGDDVKIAGTVLQTVTSKETCTFRLKDVQWSRREARRSHTEQPGFTGTGL